MAEKILIEYQVAVAGLKADMKDVQNSFKETEKAGVDSAKNTANAFVKVEEKTKSLKSQLKELKAQLANATDPKDIERLAKAAGKLTDQLEDASDAARVFASESKFEQMGNALGSVGSKLRNLDFKGAADQSKLLVSASKSITFKDAIGGLKDLGGTLLNIGKSLLMNPLFLIGGAVIAIIANFDKLKNSGGLVGSMFTAIGDAIGAVKDGFFLLTDAIGLTDTAASDAAEAIQKTYSALESQIGKTFDRIIKTTKASGEDTYKLELEKAQKLERLAQEQYFNFIRDIQMRDKNKGVASEEELIKQNELYNKMQDAAAEAQSIELTQETKTRDAKKKADDEAAAKLLELQKKIASETKAINDRLAKELAANTAEVIAEIAKKKADGFGNETDLEVDEAKRRSDKLSELNEQVDTADKKRADDKIAEAKRVADEKMAIEQASIQFAIDGLNAISQISGNIAQGEINTINDKRDAEIEALDSQLKNKLISQEQYDKKKETIEANARKKESDIKRRQFEIDKQVAIITAIINTAVAVVKAAPVVPLQILAAATGALQIAVIASQPTPKFAKGVVGLRGAGTSTSDSIHAMLSKNESVVTSEATNVHRSLLEAMNKNQGQKYIQDFYIAPALRAQLKKNAELKDSSFASSIANSLALHSVLKDGNLLDSLKQSRKSDRENAIFIAKAIASNNQNKRNW